MKNQTKNIRGGLRALIRRFQAMKPEFLRGSLIERYKKCGKPGCKCVEGRGHGPKFYLSVSLPGSRPEMIYVPHAQVEKVKKYLANLSDIRGLLEEICEINRGLLRKREEF